MSDRATRLYFTGDAGREHFPGVPARDLGEAEIARLTDREYADITAPNPATGRALYQKTKPRARGGGGDEPKDPPRDGPPSDGGDEAKGDRADA